MRSGRGTLQNSRGRQNGLTSTFTSSSTSLADALFGCVLADAESAGLFKALFDDTIAKHQVPPGQLTLHADRGSPMKAKATAFLLADLGVTKSHSRPHTSNDNPFSESHYKTLKYQPNFPSCFGCMEDAKIFCWAFFAWYNQTHHHAGLGLMTPDQVHYGQIDQIHAARQITLDHAFEAYPERFVKSHQYRQQSQSPSGSTHPKVKPRQKA